MRSRRKRGWSRGEVRLDNLVRPEQMPFDNITNKHFDSGDYPEACGARCPIDVEGVRARQREGEADGRRIGVGVSIYCEQAAHGTSVYSGWGIPMVPGHEQASARLTPDGGLELRVGVHSHGQGMETTLRPGRARNARRRCRQGRAHPRRHGDDAVLDRHLGIAFDGDGGRRGRDRLPRTGRARQAHRRASCCSTIRLRSAAGRRGSRASGSVTLQEIAHTWYRAAAGSAGGCRSGRAGGDVRLQAAAR